VLGALPRHEVYNNGTNANTDRIHNEVGDKTAFLAVSEEAPSNNHDTYDDLN